MFRALTTVAAACLLSVATLACSSTSNNGSGGAGTNGGAGTTGSAGTTGAGGGAFMAVAPCATESAYVTGTTVDFTSPTVLAFVPACLEVSPGATVTFTGDFLLHTLLPSGRRGTLTGNPIQATGSVPDGGTSVSFTFPTPGFYGFFCDVHSNDLTGMEGVVWVR